MKPPETLDKESKVPLSKEPLMLTEPPTVSNSEKPSNDFKFSLSEICKAPPMEVNLGKSSSSKSSFLLMVNEFPMDFKFANLISSIEDEVNAMEPLATVKFGAWNELMDCKMIFFAELNWFKITSTFSALYEMSMVSVTSCNPESMVSISSLLLTLNTFNL
ncbi:conserved hypothetical protein [Lodderomyces elongisporus NRRL YB-4239]|uniref:Uncharacterized protein n=1 Tax=Lodderomyces elongisporus (strain ATCC 11503 / CBS 2605 / JCM 1781 / NBRC 1676 / NRRL YB-4239) TaxID=379508 RepID=A5DVZ6_LODEL|nr:conserved hypothetical protein [Lodderomyces elongisporus NRRL YB-4239]